MSITNVTRRNIVDRLRLEEHDWSGRLGEGEFLDRIYDLKDMPSTDRRFSNAAGDIWKHREMNEDWDDYWVFHDTRFQLMGGPDEVFLRFLCEMIHPLVRSSEEDVNRLLELFNEQLYSDGWEIAESTRISGLPVFSARQLFPGGGVHVDDAEKVVSLSDGSYISQQIIRIRSSIDADPELAIGTAKELVETVCKTILRERSADQPSQADFPKLVRTTAKELKLVPDDIPDQAKAAKTIRVLLSNLVTISDNLAVLRNMYGSGHGKEARARGLQPRHARLAVNAAIALATFLSETHQVR